MPSSPSVLADVPVEYIIQQLHLLAPHYWDKPETADCTILIPMPSYRASHSPKVDAAPHMTLRLHTEYLSAKSVFFRGLFGGVSPPDLIQKLFVPRLHPAPGPLRVPCNRLPCILPSPSSHPVVFLPVPDSSSIRLLFEWMYFGNTDRIQDALDLGDIQWEGLVRNVEYLGLPTDIKVFLGRWYRDWLLPARCSSDCTPCPPDDDDDESDMDSECDDSDSDSNDSDYHSLPSTPSTDDKWCDRGRTRDIKPLVQLCGQLRLCTT